MPFTITATDGLARCGTFLTRHAQLATPAPIIYTRRGGALYLTPDLLARLRDGGGNGGGNGGDGANANTATATPTSKPSNNACVLGLVTTQFLDQPQPELLAAIASAPSRGNGTNSNNNTKTPSAVAGAGGAGAAWAGLQGWPCFALNRDPLSFEYGPPAGARPATNSGPHVAVSSGHALADLRAWMAAVRAMAPDCFVGLADELLPCGGGGGGGDREEGGCDGTSAAATRSPLESSYEDLVRAVAEAEARAAARKRGMRNGNNKNNNDNDDNAPDAQGRVAPPPLPPLPPKAPTKPPRLAFPPGVDARVARAVERTAWWVDRCLAELEDQEEGAGAEAAATAAAAAAAAREEQDRGLPVPFERRRRAGGDDELGSATTAPAPTTPTPAPPPPLQFFAPIVGCDSPAARLISAREAARRDGPRVAGYALCGFGTGEKPSERQALLRAAITPLPRDKPRLLSGLLEDDENEGEAGATAGAAGATAGTAGAAASAASCGGPLAVLDAVALGVDLFDCAWPTASTAAGYALAFPITPEEAELGLYDDDDDEEEIENGASASSSAAASAEEAPWAAAALAATPVTSAEAAAASAAAEAAGGPTRGRRLPDGARINLWAPGFRLDRRPLAKRCSCQACAPPATLAAAAAAERGGHDGRSSSFPPPSRAYIHHLLAVEEMVAEVLLDAHNEHHWLRFFAQIRREVEKGGLAEYRRWLSGWLGERAYAQAAGAAPRAGRVVLAGKGAAVGNGMTTTTTRCTLEDD